MINSIIFDPLLPLTVLMALGGVVVLGVALAVWRGLRGWALRGCAGLVVLLALSGPSLQQEDRSPLSDIVVMIEDASASQSLSDRAVQSRVAADKMAAAITARGNTELRRVTVADGEGDEGTLLLGALNDALSQEPRGRIAGVIAVTDGQIHDADVPTNLPAPFHMIRSGYATDWDRRLTVKNAPAFAIIGEPITLTLRIDDMGAAPQSQGAALLDISIDGGPSQRFNVSIGQGIDVPLTLTHSGRNVIQFTVPTAAAELTDRNNTSLIQIKGVRDRLRVLLVSGEPHAGGRTWRNLLKSDSSVDLVHFTILRPPGKQDGVPVEELSLIPFPTRELFLEKINDFDLIIFDRYKRRGILPVIYLENIVNYVEQGGAVLVAAGPDFASADSIYRSPLGRVIPAEPTARVLEEPYLPVVTDLGQRHPVTANLQSTGEWGKWLRQIDVVTTSGDTVMEGVDGRPLLVLDRVGEGRVALLASDHAWLWNRGYDGGGPQLELLRRLGHWMMKEPDLEEEALTANAIGQTMRITRRTLAEDIPDVTITAPDGTITTQRLDRVEAGKFEGMFEGSEIGLYRLSNGDQDTVIGLGPAAPREFVNTIATDDILAPAIKATGGGTHGIEDGLPSLRNVREGRPATGRGWIGLTPRHAFEVRGVRLTPLLPSWLVLLIVGLFIIGAWLREGQR
ncbi:MAG: hypothetical protein OSA49_13935 [Ascidiaceihabitans sp.]|nr:hypothetical protein [Ascidiaceihabitans sp.]